MTPNPLTMAEECQLEDYVFAGEFAQAVDTWFVKDNKYCIRSGGKNQENCNKNGERDVYKGGWREETNRKMCMSIAAR